MNYRVSKLRSEFLSALTKTINNLRNFEPSTAKT